MLQKVLREAKQTVRNARLCKVSSGGDAQLKQIETLLDEAQRLVDDDGRARPTFSECLGIVSIVVTMIDLLKSIFG
ncbi:MAG TPA: hypothetical protein VGM19_00590 [Armatimonadota bacterium]